MFTGLCHSVGVLRYSTHLSCFKLLFTQSEYTMAAIHYFQNVLLDIIEMVMTVKCALDFQ